MKHSFIGWFAQYDNRTRPQHEFIASSVRIVIAHRELRNDRSKPWLQRTAALAATPDNRSLSTKVDRRCACGQSSSTRRHLAWHCMHSPASNTWNGTVEESLCVRCIPTPPKLSKHALPPQARLITALAAAKPVDEGCVIVATDGGATQYNQYHQRAGTGIAIFDATHGHASHTCGNELRGADQTSWGSEVDALEQVVCAAVQASRSVHILVDNKAVLDSYLALTSNKLPLPRFGYGRWVRIREQLQSGQAKGLIFSGEWIPSHGKTKRWQSVGPLPTKQARDLNELADLEASRAAKTHHNKCLEFRDNADAAKAWSKRALDNVSRATERWMRHHNRVFSDQIGYWC